MSGPVSGFQVVQTVGAGTTSFQLMSKVVQQLPSYHLWLGTDMAQIPGVITRLIERELRATAKTTNA
jgi:hypothetical protein